MRLSTLLIGEEDSVSSNGLSYFMTADTLFKYLPNIYSINLELLLLKYTDFGWPV